MGFYKFMNFTIVAKEMVQDKPKQSRANIQVHIRDVNDNSPEFLTDSYEVFVAENVGPGSTIAWIRAEDKDSGILGNFIQSLIDRDLGTGQVFSKRIEITIQIHIRKFEEYTACGRVPCCFFF